MGGKGRKGRRAPTSQLTFLALYTTDLMQTVMNHNSPQIK